MCSPNPETTAREVRENQCRRRCYTVEDETGLANLILWPDRYTAQRRLVLSAAMLACHGRVQREGEVGARHHRPPGGPGGPAAGRGHPRCRRLTHVDATAAKRWR